MQVPGLYLLQKLSCSPLCVEICKFSLQWEQGVCLSKVRLTPSNWPTLNISYYLLAPGSYLLRKLSCGQTCWNSQITWQQGWCEQTSLIPLNRTTLKPLMDASIWVIYLLQKLSYSQYRVEISKFSLLWQRGRRSQQSLTDTLNFTTLKPPTGCKYLGYISYASWAVQCCSMFKLRRGVTLRWDLGHRAEL